MDLIERDGIFTHFDELVERARRGTGAMVALGGEAGIGKTSVVEALRGRHNRTRFLLGRCDSLSTPRPLGPLHDMAADRAPGIAGPLREGRSRYAVFDAFLDELRSSLRPTVAVVEDVHWADQATLDLVKFVGRRIGDTHAVFIVTYRDDEVGPSHPLVGVLGDLATARGVLYMTLDPLSLGGVAALAEGSSADPEKVFRATDGNPFYVTEVLASGSSDVPPSVADAVLARAARLDPAGRRVIEAASIIPDRAPMWLMEGLVTADRDAVDQAVDRGLLVAYDGGLRFRHELARRAVEGALDATGRTELHRRAIVTLEEPPAGEPDPAQLVYHAERAGDGARVSQWGRIAADQAVRSGSYGEAYVQARRVLRFREWLDDASQATVLEQLGEVCRLVNRAEEGVEAFEEARLLRERLGDPIRLGLCLAELGTSLWQAGQGRTANAPMEAAIDMLEALEPSPELGHALASGAALAMLQRRTARAVELGERAAELGERFDAPATVARARNAVGSAKVVSGRPEGELDLLRAIEASDRGDLPWLRVSALGNLGSGFGEIRDYERATRHLDRAVIEAARYDIDLTVDYCTAWLARVHFEQGRWGVAVLTATKAMRRETGSPMIPIVALTVLGRVGVRRGERDPSVALAQAQELAEATGDLQRTWPVAAGLAELAWMEGRPEHISGMVGDLYTEAVELGVPWAKGELAYWMWRAGALDEPPPGCPDPIALQIAGDWRGAAAAWADLGCPYEEADAFAGGDDDALLRAVETFDALGARPAASRVRRQMRARGLQAPRGPRPATKAHPAGLTPRQSEVLDLLTEGMTNAEIAERLFISVKTVDHHVSAILAKLGAKTRGEAAAMARNGFAGAG